MNTIQKKKLCWNCEGNVARDAANCPYCGVYLHRDEDREDYEEDHVPPYALDEEEENSQVPEAPYAELNQHKQQPPEQTPLQILNGPQGEWKAVALPLTMLLGGSVALLFAVLLLLFSHNGTFTVQWNANYWYVYLLIALPLLVTGWRSLSSLREG